MTTKRKTTSQFIEQAKQIHGNQYDYSKVHYSHQLEKIDIRCLKHNYWFQRTPKQHYVKKLGCPLCMKERVKPRF